MKIDNFFKLSKEEQIAIIENEGLADMTGLFKEISELTKRVKKAIY